MDISALKERSKKTFKDVVQKMQETKTYNDDRMWNLTVDKAKNGAALIRFLPAPKIDGEEAVPFIKYWDHAFKGPGGQWYIERSLTTLGLPDPVSESNKLLWDSGNPDNKSIVSGTPSMPGRKRRLHYVANILVIKDPAKPENDGRIFLFRFGAKIYDKIKEAMSPEADEINPKNPVDVFDFWAGANFYIKAKNVEGYQNYDSSEFKEPSVLFEDDDKLNEIWEQEYSLLEFIDKKNYKTYDELAERFNRVVGNVNGTPTKSEATVKYSKPKVEEPEEDDDNVLGMDFSSSPDTTAEDADSGIDYFKKLVDAD